MPFELKVPPGENLANVRGWGSENFASTVAALRAIAKDSRLVPGMPVPMDVGELEYFATPLEVEPFATPDSASGLWRGRRVAVLARRGAQFGVARTFANKAGGSEARVEVFTERSAALRWLEPREGSGES